MDEEPKPRNIENFGYETSFHSENDERGKSLQKKSRGVFKITCDTGFGDDFYSRFNNLKKSSIRIGKRIQGPNSDTQAKVERIDKTDEELIDFVKGNVNSVGISNGSGVLMQRIIFNSNAFKDEEMENWLNDRNLPQELTDSKDFKNHKETVLLSESEFFPTEWRLYSFKDNLKVITGYFENF